MKDANSSSVVAPSHRPAKPASTGLGHAFRDESPVIVIVIVEVIATGAIGTPVPGWNTRWCARVTSAGPPGAVEVTPGIGAQGHQRWIAQIKDKTPSDLLSVVAIRRVIQDVAHPFLQFAGAQFGQIDARCELSDPGTVVTPARADAAIGRMRSTGTSAAPDFVVCRPRRSHGGMMRGDRPGRPGEVRACVGVV